MSSRNEQQATIDTIIDWLLAQALGDFQIEQLVSNVAERMVDIGYRLYRLHLTVRLLHPIYSGTAFTWVEGEGLQRDSFRPGDNESQKWLRSPLHYMLGNGLFELRLRIDRGEGLADYPLIQDLNQTGATDYLAILTGFGDTTTAIEREDGVVVSWVSRSPGGWTDDEIAGIRRLQSRLALVVRLALRKSLAENVLSAYLGEDAGRRVLAGQIRRGDGEDIEAVIWFSDLRSSTRLAESLGKDDFLELLNHFFECTAGAVQASRGEVLRYIGDSVLAIFPFERFGGATEACHAAFAAAQEAASQVAELNRKRQAQDAETLGFGIGLHPGIVMFGNIGIPERLDFSVVGPAANEAARVADQCRDLKQELIVSERFCELAGGEWRSLGSFRLRNVKQPMELFAPDSISRDGSHQEGVTRTVR
jgi:adenylate cyclase